MIKYYLFVEYEETYIGEFDDITTLLNNLNILRIKYENDENFKFKIIVGHLLKDY